MAIISVLNWLWRKSIDLLHLWKTGFRSEFALKWNQFGGLLTQCLGTTDPHHTITLLLLFSLVAFTRERQRIIGERKAKMGLRMKVDLGEIWQPPLRWQKCFTGWSFDEEDKERQYISYLMSAFIFLYRASLSYADSGYDAGFPCLYEIEMKLTLKNSQWK